MYKKLERELHEKKREIASVIDVSNIAYEARDQARALFGNACRRQLLTRIPAVIRQARNEIAALRAQSDKEQATFEMEYREVRAPAEVPHAPCPGLSLTNRRLQLGRLIDEDRKAREAALRAEAEKIYEYGQQEDEKRRKAKNNWGMVREKKTKALEADSDKPVAYDEVFAKIQAATGITHVEELVAAFVSAEDHNFSMFNYVNELNQEAEKLEEQAAELQQEIQRHSGAGASENSFRKRLVQARCRGIVSCGVLLTRTRARRIWRKRLRPWMPVRKRWRSSIQPPRAPWRR